jgi:DNA-binding HxlR family transcriptional regulator
MASREDVIRLTPVLAEQPRYDAGVKPVAAEESARAATGSAPAAPNGDHSGCDTALVTAFGLLGKRWNGVILGTLTPDGAGFAELRRSVGAITDSVLSDRLSELAQAGLVERTVTDTRPPGVSYRLTAAGSALKPILTELAGWASENLP